MAARRLSGRTAPPMEGFGNRVWILGDNTEKCECWTVGCATTLLPIAQRRDVDADHEREFTLRGTEFLPNGLDVDPLGKSLYLIESQSKKILRFAVPADDQPLGKGELFYDLGGSGGDGCVFDAEGNFWVADFRMFNIG